MGTRGRVVILLYHRVAALDADPQRLTVQPAHFADHLQAIRSTAEVLSLTDLLTALEESRLPERGVVVTFDDGYADNATTAAPLLEGAAVPATFFVTTSYVDGAREFWWDELEQWFLGTDPLPPTLHLTIAGRPWNATRLDTTQRPAGETRASRDWTVEQGDPTPRHTAYRDLCTALKALSGVDRQRVLDEITEQTGRRATVRETHRSMTAAEVAALGRRRGMTIGAHSVTHPSLAALPIQDQRLELEESRAALTAITGHPVPHFAYPFGSRCDQTWRTRRATRAAGYQAACANEAGLVRNGANHFRLPRLLVRDWDGPTFTRQLEHWLDG